MIRVFRNSVLYIGAAIFAALLVTASYDAHSQAVNGKVTTAAPTYANGATAPLSLDTSGGLRLSGSFTANSAADATALEPTYNEGDSEPLSQDLSGHLRVLAGPNGLQDVDVTATVGLTDTELRASPVPVDIGTPGTLDVDVTATVGLTDTELRASNVDVAVNAPLPAGTNNIGDVDVLSLPSIPAGNNNIGDVDVATLPALPSGTNTIGATTTAPVTLTASSTITAVATPVVIKASAGTLHFLGFGAINGTATVYDNASACSGTIRMIVATSTAGAQNISFANPLTFTTGITFCQTAIVSAAWAYQ